jgi:hypothetical protein
VPKLFDALEGRCWRRRSIVEGLQNNSWISDIRGPLTVPILIQYIQLCEQVKLITLDPVVSDSTIWRWESSGIYSASSAYQALFLGHHVMEGAKEVWKA